MRGSAHTDTCTYKLIMALNTAAEIETNELIDK